MSNYTYEQISQHGEGVVKIGEQSYKSDWHLNGLQKIIETRYLDGSIGRTKGLMDYVTINIAFQEKPNQNDLPRPGEQTSLMLDSTRYGSLWVICYGESDGQVTVELSNRRTT